LSDVICRDTAGGQRANDENAEGPHGARLARRSQRSQMSATNHGRQDLFVL
jgi:hypothetical protein